MTTRTLARPGGAWRWCRAHPDCALLLGAVVVGGLVRLALLYRIPPLFMPGDSQSFLIPAYDLAHGLGFDPILKRPLGYPLFVAAIMAVAGESLQALVFVQAAIGLGTVAATYCLGRFVFGRAAGALGAFTVALGGQLLIYEHYVLAESLFAFLLALATLLVVLAGRGSWRWALAGGVAIGLAAQLRPVAEVALPLVPLFFLASVRQARSVALLSASAVAGFLIVFAPATMADLALRGGLSGGAIGEHLIWRLTRSDTGYFTRENAWRLEASASDRARQYVARRAIDRTLPQEIHAGVQREFGLSPAEADRLMFSVAVDAIRQQPARYAASTARMALELMLGPDQQLGEVSKRDGESRYSNPQSRQRTWFEERVLHLAEPPGPSLQNEFERAESLTRIYQPGMLGPLVPLGFLLGLGLAIRVPAHRGALFPALVVLAMILANAALAGPEARFRYPMDPLIGVLAAGGLVAALGWLWSRLAAPIRRFAGFRGRAVPASRPHLTR